jgi:hypothetical protein
MRQTLFCLDNIAVQRLGKFLLVRVHARKVSESSRRARYQRVALR